MEEGIYDVLTDADSRRFTNPTDHLGRKAEDIDALRDAGTDPGEILCVECRSSMDVRGGGSGRARHLYHTRNNATQNCGGTSETAWHFACKTAAESAGWSKEHTVDLPQGRRRADAFRDGQFLEFVHTLSDTYERKHRQLAENGIACRWIVDSAASFHSPYGSEQFDFAAAMEGTMRVSGLFKPKDACLLDALGHGNLFAYYRSAIWRCIGHDEWEVLPQDDELQALCTNDGGINYEIVMANARSEELRFKVLCRPGMQTDWRTQVAYLVEEVFSERSDLMREAMKILAEKESRYSAAPPSSDYDIKEPVCRQGRSSRYLTHSQVEELLSEAELRVSRPSVRSFVTSSVRQSASSVASRPGYLSHAPTESEFRARCESYGTHEMHEVVEGDFVKTVCKWCGKFYGKSPLASHRPLLLR
jgi:hypothetical protein